MIKNCKFVQPPRKVTVEKFLIVMEVPPLFSFELTTQAPKSKYTGNIYQCCGAETTVFVSAPAPAPTFKKFRLLLRRRLRLRLKLFVYRYLFLQLLN
jgi:hypothetical protein